MGDWDTLGGDRYTASTHDAGLVIMMGVLQLSVPHAPIDVMLPSIGLMPIEKTPPLYLLRYHFSATSLPRAHIPLTLPSPLIRTGRPVPHPTLTTPPPKTPHIATASSFLSDSPRCKQISTEQALIPRLNPRRHATRT
jgi:hypothetical protein